MAYLWIFGCFINRHEPSRRTVEWDGLVYNGTCKHCSKAITRLGPKNWRASLADEAAEPAAAGPQGRDSRRRRYRQ